MGGPSPLQAIVAWGDGLGETWTPQEPAADRRRQAVVQSLALAVAHKVLADRANPEAGDQLVSVVDPAAHRGKHGAFYTGYSLAVALDADSELITALNLLPAHGDEAADATTLIAQEEQAHGDDVQALSLDSIGWRGALLRQWQDPAGRGLAVCVPPVPPPAPTAT